jgi:hypothetical protein
MPFQPIATGVSCGFLFRCRFKHWRQKAKGRITLCGSIRPPVREVCLCLVVFYLVTFLLQIVLQVLPVFPQHYGLFFWFSRSVCVCESG